MTYRLAIGIVLVMFTGSSEVLAQNVLTTPAPYAGVEGLNTIPDHGDTAVSWLDYWNGSYRIMLSDRATEIEQEIAAPFYAEPEAVTFGDRVAWIGYTPQGVPDVYVYDGSGASTEQVTSDAAFQNHPDLGDRYLVWQDYSDSPDDGSGADIRAREHGAGVFVRVTDDDAYQDLPGTYGDRIVWQDFRHAGETSSTAEIYVYNGITEIETRITTGSAYRTNPSIWNDLVVWEDYRHGQNAEIYLYDLSSGTGMRITSDTAQQSHPAVYGRWVIWLDYRNSATQGDLFGFNLDSQQEYPLVVHPAHQDQPSVHGHHVVWQDYRNASFDIWAAELLDPDVTNIGRTQTLKSEPGFAAPNPSVGPVSLIPGELFGAHDRVDVVDMLGRVVWSVRPATGAYSVEWDGTDASNRPVSPGVYVALIRRGETVARIMFVRN